MRSMKGFTLIELMIVVAIIAILVAIALPAFNKGDGKHIKITERSLLHGTTSMCVDGYKFIKTEGRYDRNMTQVLDANGNGIPCN